MANNSFANIGVYNHAICLRDQNAMEDHVSCICTILQKPAKFSTLSLDSTTCGPYLLYEIAVYSRRHLALTRKTRGLDRAQVNSDYETPTIDDMDGDFVLAQRLEVTSQHSLAHVVDEIVCRNSDVPECTPACDDNQYSMHWTGANDAGSKLQPMYPQFTGKALCTDKCVLVGGRLYAALDQHDTNSYARALLNQEHDPDSVLAGVVFGAKLDAISLAQLPQLACGEPCWLLPMGDCEHFWQVERVR